MFKTHQSNRLENLFVRLVETVKQPLANVFSAETIIVQSQGMARWLSLELAKKQGISANLNCPFPASFIWRLFQQLDVDLRSAPVSPFDPEALVWSVMKKIKELHFDDDFADIRGFLEVDDSDIRAYQLAAKISTLLDQYLMHRPDWIKSWSAGQSVEKLRPGQRWQSKLWRAIVAEHGTGKHRASLAEAFIANCDETFLPKMGVERLCLFGIPALSQLHLDVFVHLSHFIDVHLFLLTPCAEFTDDLIDVRQLERMRLQPDKMDPVKEYYELGCPLLMSLGGMGLDFAAMLNNYDLLSSWSDDYGEPVADTLLSLVHSDLLTGTEFAAENNPVHLAENDSSIQIHSAHSPMREVEILQDSLLELLNSSDELGVRDIIVMVPDITQYAPLIEAVFSTPLPGDTKIPYSIADQSATDGIVLAFVELLQVAASRFSASGLLAFLDREPIRQRFEISFDDMQIIRHWVVTSGIRSGKGNYQALEAEEDGVGTWQKGLDRLMLGFVQPGGCDVVFGGLMPCDGIEGGDGQNLAKLLSFFETLREFSSSCSNPKSISDWCAEFDLAVDSFFVDKEENYFGLQKIRGALQELAAAYEAAKADVVVSLEVVSSILEKKIVVAQDHHFLSGKVTFCQMVPMRSIPFKVICLLGMNDSSFPRQDKPLGFDLMKGNSRPGDRCRRDDDRHLFLETILSARQNLYISYVGQNDTDHRELPPSAVVSELIDYLGWRLGLDSQSCQNRFVTKHALQPFSRRYFSNELSSFSVLNWEVAQSLAGDKLPAGFFDGYLPHKIDLPSEIDLTELISFFHHPIKYMLKRQYDLHLEDYYDEIEDRSCFMLDSLDQYKLSSELSSLALVGELESQSHKRYQLTGDLPQGVSGAFFYGQSRECALEVKSQFENLKTGTDCDPYYFELDSGTLRIFGVLDGMTTLGQYLYRPTTEKKIGYRDLVTSWLRHLVMSACLGEGSTTFICRDGGRQFSFYPKAKEVLFDLTKIYAAGQQRPLPLMPGASFAYAKRMWGMKKGGGLEEKALQEARAKWLDGGFYGDPECNDPYLKTVYQSEDPFLCIGEYGFCALAEKVLSLPLIHGVKIS